MADNSISLKGVYFFFNEIPPVFHERPIGPQHLLRRWIPYGEPISLTVLQVFHRAMSQVLNDLVGG